MRWVEFLIFTLIAHAQTLQRLAALFGENELQEMLERVAEDFEVNPLCVEIQPEWFQIKTSVPQTYSDPYKELEWAVSELNLSPIIEFHLWAYPFYRILIESEIELNTYIQPLPSEFTHVLVNEAVKQAKDWIKRIPIHPEQSLQTEKTTMVPWLRFRSEVLKKFGHSPMAPIG